MNQSPQTDKNAARGHWSSKLGFILAAVGSAVGLGNIWKFPYIVGESGGAAFIFFYLICIGIIGLPVLVAEWMIGRRGQLNPAFSMLRIARQDGLSRHWQWLGVVGIAASFIILSFYNVIGGWTLDYIVKSGGGEFTGLTLEASGGMFEQMLGSPGMMLVYYTLFSVVTAMIVGFGVSSGIEAAAKVLMPLLAILLVGMVLYGTQLPGFGRAVEFLMYPKWERLTSTAILVALGHAFFTLSLGMGIMMSYGSHLDDDVSLTKTGLIVVGLDTVIALGAGLAIFPVVFSHGLDATSGPGLIFQTLPIAFGNLPGGTLYAISFFVLLCFAALTSAISLLEPSVEILEEKAKWGRWRSTLVVSAGIWLLGLLPMMSSNLLKDVKPLLDRTFFDLFDFVTSSIMMPLVGMGAVVFCGWFMNQERVETELGLGRFGWLSWLLLSRFIAPLGILVVFLEGLGGFTWLYGVVAQG